VVHAHESEGEEKPDITNLKNSIGTCLPLAFVLRLLLKNKQTKRGAGQKECTHAHAHTLICKHRGGTREIDIGTTFLRRMGLWQLFCGSGAVGGGSKARRGDLQPAEAQEGTMRKSLAVGSDVVIQRQIETLEEEQRAIKELHEDEVTDLENKFKELVDKYGKNEENEAVGEMTKEQLRKAFSEMGIRFEPELFEKVWLMIDADNSGTVNTAEFVVSFSVLMFRGSAKDNVQLAFRLFDTNRDNGISRREFNDMIASVIGTRVKNVLAIEMGRECFEEYLQTELSDELLRFVDAVEYLHEDRMKTIGKEYADAIWSKFIQVGSDDQVNISDSERAKIRQELDKYTDDDDEIPIDIFDAAAKEAVALIEEGPLNRFKSKLRHTYSLFADKVWKELEKSENDTLSEEEFREWTERTPGLFTFLDQVHDLLEGSSFTK